MVRTTKNRVIGDDNSSVWLVKLQDETNWWWFVFGPDSHEDFGFTFA